MILLEIQRYQNQRQEVLQVIFQVLWFLVRSASYRGAWWRLGRKIVFKMLFFNKRIRICPFCFLILIWLWLNLLWGVYHDDLLTCSFQIYLQLKKFVVVTYQVISSGLEQLGKPEILLNNLFWVTKQRFSTKEQTRTPRIINKVINHRKVSTSGGHLPNR